MTERADLERWGAALGRVAARIERERGVEDPWSLSVEDDVLWANYGDLRVRVGPDGDVDDEAELFDEVDGWVAFDRSSGPGIVMDRDVEARAVWMAGLPALQQFWEPIVARVIADVVRTTAIDASWCIVVDEWRLDLPSTPGLWLTFDAQDVSVREVAFPSLALALPQQSFTLPAMEDVEEAAAFLADRVQDYVIEQIPGAWPTCPGHHHPMRPNLRRSGSVWCCPVGTGSDVLVGALTGQR